MPPITIGEVLLVATGLRADRKQRPVGTPVPTKQPAGSEAGIEGVFTESNTKL